MAAQKTNIYGTRRIQIHDSLIRFAPSGTIRICSGAILTTASNFCFGGYRSDNFRGRLVFDAQSTGSAETRKHPRFAVVDDIPVTAVIGQTHVVGKLLNLSEDGFAIILEQDAGEVLLSAISIQIPVPTRPEPIKIEGVVRNKGDHGVDKVRLGGLILKISENDHAEFLKLINQAITQHGLLRTLSRRARQEDFFPA